MIFNRRLRNWPILMFLALTIGLAFAWLAEPMLVSSNGLVRLGLVSGCLATASLLFHLEMRRQTRNEIAVLRYIERLCMIDHHDLVNGEADRLPPLDGRHTWRRG